MLGIEHPDTLTRKANLALMYREQGRYKQAKELGLKAVQDSERVLGGEHPDTLISMAVLALTYNEQGRWKESEEVSLRVLNSRK